ncbi:syncytin-1-like [Cavia porcellus]|uniref:syncytin-1-like n=1 Tax=Cavia porcellus TaxID=10141 RepID=UPI002FE3E3D7
MNPKKAAFFVGGVVLALLRISMVHAGLGGPTSGIDLRTSLLGSPCDCGGGTVSSIPPSAKKGPGTDCGDKTAFSVVYPSTAGGFSQPSYQCILKPKVSPSGPGDLATCPCTKFEESMHVTCYAETKQCKLKSTTYWMATLTTTKSPVAPNHIPAAVGSSPFMQSGCNGEVGEMVCWSMTAPVHISDGGGVQDQYRQEQVIERWEQLNPFPEVNYHPLLRPKSRGINLDPATESILEATHKALNLTDPGLASDCWLCMMMGESWPLAMPFRDYESEPYNYSTPYNCSHGPPFRVQFMGQFNASCFQKYPQNNSYDIVVGALAVASCESITNVSSSSPLCAPFGKVFACGNGHAYTYLPSNWTGLCGLAYLLPDIGIVPGDQPIPIPAVDTFIKRHKRDVLILPLLAGLGITGALATGTAGLGVSLTKYTQLSKQLIEDMSIVERTLQEIQDQIDSLAEVVLQNRRGLDLLTVERGGICIALQERCCFYANKSRIVRDQLKKLQEDLEKRRKELQDNPFWGAWNGLLPYILPLLGPLCSLLLLLLIGPCLLRWVTSFINGRLAAARRQVRLVAHAALAAARDGHNDPQAYAWLARLAYDRV